MPFDRAYAALVNIEYIDLPARFLEGFTYETFCDDLKTFYAVTRALEIISEASRRLPNELKARHPEVPWQAIADAGNFYRHSYERVIEQPSGKQQRPNCRSSELQFEPNWTAEPVARCKSVRVFAC